MITNKHNYENCTKYTACAGYFLLILFVLVFLGHCNIRTSRNDYISPLSGIDSLPEEAEAHDVVLSCDTPKGYLECKVYKGEITWEDHNKLFRIVDECENRSWDPNATHVNKGGSIDRGIFMINDKWHKELTNDEAFDYKKNIDYAIKLYKKQGVKPWVCARILNIK